MQFKIENEGTFFCFNAKKFKKTLFEILSFIIKI
jgi:hypothetical protein